MSTITDELAQRLAEAWRSGVPIPAAACPADLTAAQAYAVQDALVQRLPAYRGGRPAWKVGAANAQAAHTAAPLPSEHLAARSLKTPQARDLCVEAEVAFELDAGGAPRRMAVAIEVAGSRYVEGMQAPAAARLADLQSHVALITGPLCDALAIDWASQHCRVLINDVEVASTVGTHPCGDPQWGLPWLREHASQRDMPLRVGDIVTTGAWTGMHPVRAGDRVVVEFAGIGRAELTLQR